MVGGEGVQFPALMFDIGDTTTDLSALYRAWERHYTDMGLAANKLRTCVLRRVAKRKMPK